MSSFSCDVVKLDIEPHPDADALDLARIGDYRAVVAKGMFKSGDMAVYIPEASVLPGPVIEKLGLVGRLAGSNKNRVKAIKLRGVLSQGLVYPIKNNLLELPDGKTIQVKVGDDVSAELGIKKYEPEIPVAMAGEVFNLGTENTLAFDVENIKKFPDFFNEGECVEITEKFMAVSVAWLFCRRIQLRIFQKIWSPNVLPFLARVLEPKVLQLKTTIAIRITFTFVRSKKYLNNYL